MGFRTGIAGLIGAGLLALSAGCADTRGNESSGAYVDDASITSTVKARLVEDKTVDAPAIGVETSNGNVVLSGVRGARSRRAPSRASR